MRTKTYNCVADLHLFSSYEMKLDKTLWPEENLILLGDVYDLRNTLKKNVPKLQEEIREFAKTGIVHVSSNHTGLVDGVVFPNHWIDEETKTIMIHGHQVKENSEHYYQCANSYQTGCSLFKYLLKGTYNRLPRLVPFSSDDARRASDMAKSFGCKTIICAHYHVSSVYDEMVLGVRVVVVPRGLTKITVEY